MLKLHIGNMLGHRVAEVPNHVGVSFLCGKEYVGADKQITDDLYSGDGRAVVITERFDPVIGEHIEEFLATANAHAVLPEADIAVLQIQVMADIGGVKLVEAIQDIILAKPPHISW